MFLYLNSVCQVGHMTLGFLRKVQKTFCHRNSVSRQEKVTCTIVQYSVHHECAVSSDKCSPFLISKWMTRGAQFPFYLKILLRNSAPVHRITETEGKDFVDKCTFSNSPASKRNMFSPRTHVITMCRAA